MAFKIKSWVTINPNEAEQIAKLLSDNEWNRPGKPYSEQELLDDPEGYFLALEQNKIVGVARLKKVQWYQWELFSISVHSNFQRQGTAQSVVRAVEDYVHNQKGPLIQATVDPKNSASENLFNKLGWAPGIKFIHPAYKKPMRVWQKVINILE